MAVDFTFQKQDGFARVTSRGRLETVDELVAYVRRVATTALERGVRAVLLDHRALPSSSEVMDTHRYAPDVAERIETAKPIRWAVVTAPERLPAVKHFETVAQNRGLMMLAFDAVEDAETWLRG